MHLFEWHSKIYFIQKSKLDQESDLPVYQHGQKSYRKNAEHFKEFSHPWLKLSATAGKSDAAPVLNLWSPKTAYHKKKPKKAIDIAFKELGTYLSFQAGEDDIRLVLFVDKVTLVNDKVNKEIEDDSRLKVYVQDTVNSLDYLNDIGSGAPCRFMAVESSWRLKRTENNKMLYQAAGLSFEKETKTRHPDII
ncbi:hypothetical protein SAMD00019534_085220 [Acytostelium subglobosum LB1]|uniref:hypothetical protein n=1 Tax=Acytostelium subglobosum LB1 TaxID=1410327 RepID=UPI0006447B78|nr:hypothetical protein SAMD00019534_085220 [Acytostelium subglobosum LB1]GAM25347.1 hypothetical protein SAMD00019534_085220 [Acytostelium subglobosum LB1]|eukprot:XP_012751867.1 hypothetical protein SAMD00019534_085220 [Acytostelium subglobosum LB1]